MADRILGTVRDYSDLLAILRARCEALNITRATLDYRAGLPDGYAGKVLGPKAGKGFGPKTLVPVMQTLGLALQVVEDSALADQIAKLPHRNRPPPPDFLHWRTRRAMLALPPPSPDIN